jgi:hypothetical protein
MDAPEHTARLARCPRCEAPFSICKHCDRGHVYCGPRCSALARSESLRRARRRHRQSPEGRLDHRDRERDRRQRQRREAARVGDHPSAPQACSAKVAPSFTAVGGTEPAVAHSVAPLPLELRLDVAQSPSSPSFSRRPGSLRHCSRCGVFVPLFARSQSGAGSRASPA